MQTKLVANLALKAGAQNGQANTFAQRWTTYTIAKEKFFAASKGKDAAESKALDTAKTDLKNNIPTSPVENSPGSSFAQRFYDLAKEQYRKHKVIAIATGVVSVIGLFVGGLDALFLSKGKDIIELIATRASKLSLPSSLDQALNYYARPLIIGAVALVSGLFSLNSKAKKNAADQASDAISEVAKVKLQYD